MIGQNDNHIINHNGDPELRSVNNLFEERSEATQEIVSKKPGFLEKWALILYLFILIGLIVASWFIKYPDYVTEDAILVGENYPKEIISNRSGRLLFVTVKNNQVVKTAEILGWLESNASIQEVVQLSDRLHKSIQLLNEDNVMSVFQIWDSSFHQLGELQTSYQVFLSELENCRRNMGVIGNETKIKLAGNALNKPHAILGKSVAILKRSVDNWLNQNTLQAPIDGQVLFTMPFQPNKYIEQGKLIGYIIPANSRYFAEVKISQDNIGKIDTGMSVQLRFNAYPYQEIGFVPGKLTYLSKIAIDNKFLGVIQLDNNLTTNFNKTITFRNGLQAQAVIISKDMRLQERFYNKIFRE